MNLTLKKDLDTEIILTADIYDGTPYTCINIGQYFTKAIQAKKKTIKTLSRIRICIYSVRTT